MSASAVQAAPLAPVVLTGAPDQTGGFQLAWTPGVGLGAVEGYVLVRTVLGEDPVRIALGPDVTSYLDTEPAERLASYVVVFVMDGVESPPSNPVLRSYPRCMWYEIYTYPPPPDVVVHGQCLWPPPI